MTLLVSHVPADRTCAHLTPMVLVPAQDDPGARDTYWLVEACVHEQCMQSDGLRGIPTRQRLVERRTALPHTHTRVLVTSAWCFVTRAVSRPGSDELRT